MKNQERQKIITSKIISGEYVAGKEYFCEFCYTCRNTFCGWDKEQCIKAGGLPRLCDMCCLCATAYNRSKRKYW